MSQIESQFDRIAKKLDELVVELRKMNEREASKTWPIEDTGEISISDTHTPEPWCLKED